ncbi:hypothetical protein GPALN_014680 [Globodera pallida]|nr:hypothetical protein GPALN_014680 [Globodera pallida]
MLDKLSESQKAPKKMVRRDSSRQPCGLTNAGNFCYVNSFLQTWFNDLKFRQCIYNWRPSENWTKPPTAKLNIEATMNCLQQLFITMQFTPFESTNAGAFIKLLRLGNQQQDVQEFHTLFFDTIKLNLDSHPNGRPILDVIQQFQSRINQTIFCANCNRTRVTAGEYQHSLQIAIDGHQSLISAIQSFLAPELLEDYRCDQCKGRGLVARTARLTQLPEVLIVQLSRFVVGSNGRVRKLQHAVQYPRILAGHELQQDVVGAADYKLCAVMIHQGPGMNSGHYYDIIRDPIIGKWFSYNDATVTEKPAPGYSGVLTKKPKATADTKGCYALIYRKAGSEPTGPVQSPANDVKNKLEEDFSRKHNDDLAAFGVWKKLIDERRIQLRQLWSELEVCDGWDFIDDPKDITFLPTALLSDILAKEHTAFEECKSVDSKYEPSQVSAVDIPLCEHDLVIPGPLNRGALKAVKTSAAQAMIREYNVKQTTMTGADLCLDCVRMLRAHYVSRFNTPRHPADDEGFFYPDGANIYIELKSNATNNKKTEAVTDQSMDWVSRRESRQEKAAKKLIKIKMCSDETINDLKVRIFEQTKHPLASQLLYCGRQMLEASWTLERAQIPANNHDAPLILHVQEQDGGKDEDEQNEDTSGGGFGHTALS